MLLRRHKLVDMDKQAADKPSADSVSKAEKKQTKKSAKDTKAATETEKKGGAKSGDSED